MQANKKTILIAQTHNLKITKILLEWTSIPQHLSGISTVGNDEWQCSNIQACQMHQHHRHVERIMCPIKRIFFLLIHQLINRRWPTADCPDDSARKKGMTSLGNLQAQAVTHTHSHSLGGDCWTPRWLPKKLISWPAIRGILRVWQSLRTPPPIKVKESLYDHGDVTVLKCLCDTFS